MSPKKELAKGQVDIPLTDKKLEALRLTTKKELNEYAGGLTGHAGSREGFESWRASRALVDNSRNSLWNRGGEATPATIDARLVDKGAFAPPIGSALENPSRLGVCRGWYHSPGNLI